MKAEIKELILKDGIKEYLVRSESGVMAVCFIKADAKLLVKLFKRYKKKDK